MRRNQNVPLPGLVPGTHVFLAAALGHRKTWMTGTSPVKTRFFFSLCANPAVDGSNHLSRTAVG